MKAIQQLIAYFEEKRVLKRRHVEELVAKGYWGQYTAGDIRSLEHKVGQSFIFQVTGDTRGPLWGVDIYTSDSNLGTACVHAGALAAGETGVVKVTMVKPLAVFQGSTRNGVASHLWTTGWSGAFQVELVKK
jgi:hypothetical protein